jgi:hypothetical protein
LKKGDAKKQPQNGRACRQLATDMRYDPRMADRRPASGKRTIRSEARGPHWVAWIADTNGKPEGSMVFVGETREEAEERARRWDDQPETER